MVFRISVAVSGGPAVMNQWQRCESTRSGHAADSVVHRYQREVRFMRPDNAEEVADDAIRKARDQVAQSGVGQIKSHHQRVYNFALFERYVLEQ